MDLFIPFLLNGIAIGGIYAIVALGFVLLFKSTAVLNFAHGSFVMLATYLSISLLVRWELPFLLGVAILVVVMGALGYGIHMGIMRHMVGKPFFSVVLVTVGLEIVIRAVLLVLYGPGEQGRLAFLPEGSVSLLGARMSWVNITILAIAVFTVLAFAVFFQRTRLGLQMRSVAENLEAAAAQGINPNRIYAVAWAIGMITAAVGGVLYAHYATSINLEMASVGLRAFPAAILGGLDSVSGAVLGGLLVGIVETIFSGYLGTEWREPIAFGIMFLVLLWRPTGFFGTRELVRV